MRILLFLVTNMAILVVIGVVFSLLGLNGTLQANGVDLNLQALLVISAVIGITGSVISLALSKWSAKRAMGVKIIERPQNKTEQWLLSLVEQQAKTAGIGTPEVGVFQTTALNAFATGMNRNKALVAVSSGLLQTMDADQVEAVVAHEISHIANGDMITMALLQGVINTFVYFFASIIGHFVDRVILKNERGYGIGYFVVQIIAQIALSFLASILVMWFSRRREFHADAGGAKLAGKEKMISALQALQRAQNPEQLPGQLAAFGINGGNVRKLFMSHPPLEKRIATLQENS